MLIAQGCFVTYINDSRRDIPPAEQGAGNLTDQDRLDGSYTHPWHPTTTLPTPTEPTPTPTPTVQLSCTSINGETEVVAEYDSVPCPMDVLDEDYTLREPEEPETEDEDEEEE